MKMEVAIAKTMFVENKKFYVVLDDNYYIEISRDQYYKLKTHFKEIEEKGKGSNSLNDEQLEQFKEMCSSGDYKIKDIMKHFGITYYRYRQYLGLGVKQHGNGK